MTDYLKQLLLKRAARIGDLVDAVKRKEDVLITLPGAGTSNEAIERALEAVELAYLKLAKELR